MGLVEKPKFQVLTPLFIEMKICEEILHQPHIFFQRLPRSEKLKLYAYEEMKRKREDFFNKKEQESFNKIKHRKDR